MKGYEKVENGTAWYISILQSRLDLWEISNCTGISLSRLRNLFLANSDVSEWNEFAAIVRVYLNNFGDKSLNGSVEHHTRW